MSVPSLQLDGGRQMELQIKVAQAVHMLNHDTQSCNRVAANQWLVQFQQTDAAWEVATAILTSDHRHQFISDYEVEFFAAQVLKRKVCSIFCLLGHFYSRFIVPRPECMYCCEQFDSLIWQNLILCTFSVK